MTDEETIHETALLTAANNLYATFGRYRGGPNWCDQMDARTPEQNLSLVRTRVRDLSPENFDYYAWHSVTLCMAGTPALKYFFPRILVEEAIPPQPRQQGPNRPCLEMYTSYMRQQDWHRWTNSEIDAVISFFSAWFNAATAFPLWDTDESPYYRPERQALRVLRSAAFLEITLDPLLERWFANNSPAAISQIVYALQWESNSLASRVALQSWDHIWGDQGVEPRRMHQVAAFLTSPAMRAKLETAFFRAPKKYQLAISQGLDQLNFVYSIWRNLAGTPSCPDFAQDYVKQLESNA